MEHDEEEGREQRAGGEDEYRLALRKAGDLLARRAHSARQLRRKLARRFDPETVERALERLIELRYLDDRRFAVEYAAQRLERSPRGLALLVAELRGRGVDEQDAEQALAEVLAESGEDETTLALRAARRKLPLLAGLEEPVRRERLLRFLTGGRGFSPAAALAAVDRLLDG